MVDGMWAERARLYEKQQKQYPVLKSLVIEFDLGGSFNSLKNALLNRGTSMGVFWLFLPFAFAAY